MSSMMKAMMQGAAGTAASASSELCVEDVFSTYLYTGNGSAQTIENGIALGDFGVGTSTEFDGMSDYLSRSSDLVGNAAGKTFTLSVWIYANQFWATIYANGYVNIGVDTSKRLSGSMGAADASGDGINFICPTGSIPTNKWVHILISADASNASNRSIYINDQVVSVNWLAYNNKDIAFSRPSHAVAANQHGDGKLNGRLAHFYLDYTYRDLSAEANRRLFIDANSGSTPPSTLSAQNPILYLPMTEGYAIGQNLGTGGDFTANGSPKIVQSGTEYQEGYGAGGMVWIKNRTNSTNSITNNHHLQDSERLNFDADLATNNTNSQNAHNRINVGSNGFTTVVSNFHEYNIKYASWTFRKAPKFFDIVTYTGDGTFNRSIPHSLDCDPGMVIVKSTNTVAGQGYAGWYVWHRSATGLLFLNLTNAQEGSYSHITAASNTTFTVTNDLNWNTQTYVAYLFAHNDGDGGFGESGDQDIIKCGSYSSTGFVDLGWEPQWVMIKSTTNTADYAGDWRIFDNMRGIVQGDDAQLFANSNRKENTDLYGAALELGATGFTVENQGNYGDSTIYIAIRRGPMRTPTSGSEVFAPVADLATGDRISGFTADSYLLKRTDNTNDFRFSSRLTDQKALSTDETASEFNMTIDWDQMDGVTCGLENTPNINYFFRRAPGFFDVVCDTGTGAAKTVNHSLGVVPDLIIRKRRSSPSENWLVYPVILGASELRLNQINAIGGGSSWNNTLPTEEVFTVGSGLDVNGSTYTYVSYLFASLDGISKVGSYTGNGTSQNINCGFSAGARFVLIKRTDDSGNWYLWDTARGIVTGNDKFLQLNTADPENTSYDSVDPYAAGFSVNQDAGTNINVSNGTYIFLAIS